MLPQVLQVYHSLRKALAEVGECSLEVVLSIVVDILCWAALFLVPRSMMRLAV